MQLPAVRPYAPEDLDAVLSIFHDAVHRIASRDYTAAQCAAWAPVHPDRHAWAARLAENTAYVAMRCGDPAGFGQILDDGHIRYLYVTPAHQGMGVARALMRAMLDRARELGLKEAGTEASITARPCFERYGFTVIAEQCVARGGVQFINYRMRCALRTESG